MAGRAERLLSQAMFWGSASRAAPRGAAKGAPPSSIVDKFQSLSSELQDREKLSALQPLVTQGAVKPEVFSELVRINTPLSSPKGAKSGKGFLPFQQPPASPIRDRALYKGVVQVLEGKAWRKRYLTLFSTRLEWADTERKFDRKGTYVFEPTTNLVEVRESIPAPPSVVKRMIRLGEQCPIIGLVTDEANWLTEMREVCTAIAASQHTNSDHPVLLGQHVRSSSEIKRDFDARVVSYKKVHGEKAKPLNDQSPPEVETLNPKSQSRSGLTSISAMGPGIKRGGEEIEEKDDLYEAADKARNLDPEEARYLAMLQTLGQSDDHDDADVQIEPLSPGPSNEEASLPAAAAATAAARTESLVPVFKSDRPSTLLREATGAAAASLSSEPTESAAAASNVVAHTSASDRPRSWKPSEAVVPEATEASPQPLPDASARSRLLRPSGASETLHVGSTHGALPPQQRHRSLILTGGLSVVAGPVVARPNGSGLSETALAAARNSSANSSSRSGSATYSMYEDAREDSGSTVTNHAARASMLSRVSVRTVPTIIEEQMASGEQTDMRHVSEDIIPQGARETPLSRSDLQHNNSSATLLELDVTSVHRASMTSQSSFPGESLDQSRTSFGGNRRSSLASNATMLELREPFDFRQSNLSERSAPSSPQLPKNRTSPPLATSGAARHSSLPPLPPMSLTSVAVANSAAAREEAELAELENQFGESQDALDGGELLLHGKRVELDLAIDAEKEAVTKMQEFKQREDAALALIARLKTEVAALRESVAKLNKAALEAAEQLNAEEEEKVVEPPPPVVEAPPPPKPPKPIQMSSALRQLVEKDGVAVVEPPSPTPLPPVAAPQPPLRRVPSRSVLLRSFAEAKRQLAAERERLRVKEEELIKADSERVSARSEQSKAQVKVRQASARVQEVTSDITGFQGTVAKLAQRVKHFEHQLEIKRRHVVKRVDLTPAPMPSMAKLMEQTATTQRLPKTMARSRSSMQRAWSIAELEALIT